MDNVTQWHIELLDLEGIDTLYDDYITGTREDAVKYAKYIERQSANGKLPGIDPKCVGHCYIAKVE